MCQPARPHGRHHLHTQPARRARARPAWHPDPTCRVRHRSTLAAAGRRQATVPLSCGTMTPATSPLLKAARRQAAGSCGGTIAPHGGRNGPTSHAGRPRTPRPQSDRGRPAGWEWPPAACPRPPAGRTTAHGRRENGPAVIFGRKDWADYIWPQHKHPHNTLVGKLSASPGGGQAGRPT